MKITPQELQTFADFLNNIEYTPKNINFKIEDDEIKGLYFDYIYDELYDELDDVGELRNLYSKLGNDFRVYYGLPTTKKTSKTNIENKINMDFKMLERIYTLLKDIEILNKDFLIQSTQTGIGVGYTIGFMVNIKNTPVCIYIDVTDYSSF